MAKFFDYKYQAGHSVMAHISAIEQIAAHLRDLQAPVSTVQIMSKILLTLPPSFRHFLSAWDNVPSADKTIKLLTARLVKEETITKNFNNGGSDPADLAFFAARDPKSIQQTSSALPANHNAKGGYPGLRENHRGSRGNYRGNRGSHRGSRGGYDDSILCDYCKKKGHASAICRYKSRDEGSNTVTCSYCQNKGHTVEVCRKRLRNERNQPDQQQQSSSVDFGYLSSICFAARRHSDWYADSGATQHMTDQRVMLVNFKAIDPGTWVVSGIGDNRLTVHGQGDVEFSSRAEGVVHAGTIKGVLYVPGLGTNLFSIASATDAGCQVYFTDNKVYFTREGRTEIVGQRAGKTLYHLDMVIKGTNPQLEKALPANYRASLPIWHQRLAHLNQRTILKMSSQQMVCGLDILEPNLPSHSPCEGCILGKMHRFPFSKGRTRAMEVGELVHSDVCGPMQTVTPGGSRYFVIFKDDFSGWCSVSIIKQKSEVPEKFINFTALLKNETGRQVKTLRSDNGGEYGSNEFQDWLAKSGIRHETSAPYTPQQNGVSERHNRTIVEAARSLMHTKRIPLELWGEAVDCSVYVQNRSLSSTVDVTPYEAWYGEKPDIAHLRTFGSRAFVHIPDSLRQKLDAKAQEVILVGYCKTSKAYRLWNPATRRIIISRDVIFDEDAPYDSKPTAENEPKTNQLEATRQDQSVILSCPNPESVPEEIISPAPSHVQETESQVNGIPEDTQTTGQLQDVPNRRRSSRTPIFTERYTNYRKTLKLSDQQHDGEYNYAMVAEPSTYQEAISSEEASLWKLAIKEEYDSLMLNGTWILASLPPGRTTIKNKWIFKIKAAHEGTAERYKARLVAKGYTQRFGIDYQETFAPVVKHSALRVIFAIVAALDLEMIQLDIKTAFLYGALNEEIYMEQPEGFIQPGKETEVCRLVKSIYGLKQAPRAWNTKFNDFLLKFGLVRSTADPCVYYRRQEEEMTIVAIFVDDGLVCSNKKEHLTNILEHLSTTFEMRSFPASRFVGLDISRDRSKRQLYISQPHFITKLLEKFNMVQCHPKSVPADPNSRLETFAVPKNEEESTVMEAIPYREAVGGLLYVMVMSRPDIAYAVSQVAKFSQNPGPAHWKAVKRILSYLAGTANYGLSFSSNDLKTIVGYTDADYAGDIKTRRSISGFVFLFHGGPISWASKQQSCTSLSTTEAEFVAASEASKEAIWLMRLVNEILGKETAPISLLCDNQSAIRLVCNPEFHQRTKHIDVKYYFIREQQEGRKISIEYVSTQDQLADIFTKPLPGPRYEDLRERIGVKKQESPI